MSTPPGKSTARFPAHFVPLGDMLGAGEQWLILQLNHCSSVGHQRAFSHLAWHGLLRSKIKAWFDLSNHCFLPATK